MSSFPLLSEVVKIIKIFFKRLDSQNEVGVKWNHPYIYIHSNTLTPFPSRDGEMEAYVNYSDYLA